MSVTVLNSTSILAEWRPPEIQHQNGVLKPYIVTIGCDSCHSNSTFVVTSTELVVVTLHPSYRYRLLVAAVTVESGPFSEAALFTMPEDGKLYIFCNKAIHSTKQI